MQEPDCADIGVFVGVDIAEGDHYACAVTSAGEEVPARRVRNDAAAIGQLIDDAAVHGAAALVIDTTSSAASLLMEAAARREVPVAYVTGLATRRAADLYAGAAETDPKDAAVPADYARRNADRLSWTAPSGELPARLRILNGRDADLAADATRAANRLRDALPAVSPALERALGDKPASSGGARDALARRRPHRAQRRRQGTAAGPHRQTLAPAQPAGSPTRPGPRSTRRPSPSPPRPPGATPSQSSPRTWTASASAATSSPPTSRRRTRRPGPLGKVLAGLCGFGPRTGARALAEIGDPHRFADGSRLAPHAGLAPADRQSGRSAVARKPRGGNHRPKNATSTAALAATWHDPDARAHYQRKRSQGKRHNAAVICVARRRCNIIPAMLKNPNPLPTAPTPKPAPSGLTTRQGHPPPPAISRLIRSKGPEASVI